jgi:enolase
MDAAASEFYKNGFYEPEPNKILTGKQMVDYYLKLIKKHKK